MSAVSPYCLCCTPSSTACDCPGLYRFPQNSAYMLLRRHRLTIINQSRNQTFKAATVVCRSFDIHMGTAARVLWVAVPELLHVGAVVFTLAVMVAVMGNILFGFRAQAVSSLSCESLFYAANTPYTTSSQQGNSSHCNMACQLLCCCTHHSGALLLNSSALHCLLLWHAVRMPRSLATCVVCCVCPFCCTC